MRNIILVFIFCCLSIWCSGQIKKGDLVFSGGVGYNLRSIIFPEGVWGEVLYLSNQDVYHYSKSIVVLAAADVMLTSRFSLGFVGAIQKLDGEVRYDYNHWAKFYSVRKNIATRLLVHRSSVDGVSFYSGMRLGISIYTNMEKQEYMNNGDGLVIERRGDIIMPAIQGVIGARYYLFKQVYLNFELGIGPPFGLAAGLSYKIPNNKAK